MRGGREQVRTLMGTADGIPSEGEKSGAAPILSIVRRTKQKKTLHLQCLALLPKAPLATAGADALTGKGVTGALVLTCRNLASSHVSVKNQATGTSYGGVYVRPRRLPMQSAGCGLYTGVGLSALLVLADRAMREPRHVERATVPAPRLNRIIFYIFLIIKLYMFYYL